VALTIVAVVVAIAVPTFLGLRDERAAREPLTRLADLVAETRARAVAERRALEIVFDRDGFYAMPRAAGFGSREELRVRFAVLASPSDGQIARQEVGRQEVAVGMSGQTPAPGGVPDAARPVPPFLQRWDFPPGLACSLLAWGDPDWQALDGETVRRWVFQPSGMARPVAVRFERGDAFFAAEFDLLTGQPVNERSSVAPARRGEPLAVGE
jgi:hypothetical protein